jgi:hypothetical protein
MAVDSLVMGKDDLVVLLFAVAVLAEVSILPCLLTGTSYDSATSTENEVGSLLMAPMLQTLTPSLDNACTSATRRKVGDVVRF